jgi:hypothetical protein
VSDGADIVVFFARNCVLNGEPLIVSDFWISPSLYGTDWRVWNSVISTASGVKMWT